MGHASRLAERGPPGSPGRNTLRLQVPGNAGIPMESAKALAGTCDGLMLHERKRPFRDGTTQVLFESLDFLARLATLVRRRRTQIVRPSDDGEPKADPGLPAKDGRNGSTAVDQAESLA